MIVCPSIQTDNFTQWNSSDNLEHATIHMGSHTHPDSAGSFWKKGDHFLFYQTSRAHMFDRFIESSDSLAYAPINVDLEHRFGRFTKKNTDHLAYAADF